MRDRLNAPIEWSRADGGYRYAADTPAAPHALPGLWFNSGEAYALLMMQALLAEMQPGLLGPHIAPLKARLRAVIEAGNHAAADVESRVMLLNVASRAVPDKHFEMVAAALLGRQRLRIHYYNRARNETTEREVSPQRLIHYRGNWYLAAWCHLQNAMRSFSMDAMERAVVLNTVSQSISKKELAGFVGQGYGIFAGDTVQWATLHFSAERARWVGRESWHPAQKATPQPDGSLVLELPFTDPRELLMDILRQGAHVKVVAPATLAQAVRSELQAALAHYSAPQQGKP